MVKDCPVIAQTLHLIEQVISFEEPPANLKRIVAEYGTSLLFNCLQEWWHVDELIYVVDVKHTLEEALPQAFEIDQQSLDQVIEYD